MLVNSMHNFQSLLTAVSWIGTQTAAPNCHKCPNVLAPSSERPNNSTQMAAPKWRSAMCCSGFSSQFLTVQYVIITSTSDKFTHTTSYKLVTNNK